MNIATTLLPMGKRARAARELQLARLQNEIAVTEAQTVAIATRSQLASEAANIFNQNDSGILFDLYNYTTGDAVNESDLLTMQRKAYQAWSTDGYARGWVEAFVKFVVGRTCRLTAADQDEDTQEYLDEWQAGLLWPDGHREPPWCARAEEWVRRTFRDGEAIIREFVNEVDGAYYIRFLNPMYVRNPNLGGGDWSFGIKTMPNDIERAVSYAYWPQGFTPYTVNNRSTSWVAIPADEIIHTKIGDSDTKRGRYLLSSVIADLVELNKLLRARRKLNWIRSLYAVEKTVSGSWPALNAGMHAKNKTSSGNDSTGTRELAPNESSVMVHNENVKYDFKTPNLQASDADSDIRRHGLKILVALGLSETVGLADSSNNNYSSGELAESPMVTTMRFWQGFFQPDFKKAGRAAIQAAIDHGRLSRLNSKGKERDPEIKVGFPILNPRDVEKETRALALQHEEGWVSRRTCQIQLDFDPEGEDKQIELEKVTHPEEDVNGTESELHALVNSGSNGNNGNGAASSARRTSQLRGTARSRQTASSRS